MNCRKCHAQVKESDAFCSACGTKLQFICESCGSTVAEDDVFCRKCGVTLQQAKPDAISLDVAKILSHRLNNALSIILTSSQIAMHISKSLYGNVKKELQDILNDIAEFAENSGTFIHQFQKYVDAIENREPEDDVKKLAEQIINYPQFETVAVDIKENEFESEIVEEKTQRSKKISVIVVDDESGIRQTMSYALSLAGHNVITASNGQEGIKDIQDRFYDIAFVDLILPDMEGWQVIDSIKKQSPNTMIVLMTGWNIKLDDNEVWEKNVDAMLSKPFHLSDVTDLIKNIKR
jgi:CheY-like chemotaxis protein